MIKFGIFLALSFLVSVECFRKQGIAVKGRLMCGIVPASTNTTKVKIIDKDTGPDPDDQLAQDFVNKDGEFKLVGFTRELTNIDPYLYIWHDCNDKDTPCNRKVEIYVPQKFIISEDPKEHEWVDVGEINLETTFEDEKRECIF